MTRLPWPSCTALLVLFVYHCRSWLLTLSPVSMVQLEPSTGVPAVSVSSSAHVVAAMPPSAMGVTCWLAAAGLATAAIVESPSMAAVARTVPKRGRREGRVDIYVTADVRVLLYQATKRAMVQTSPT